MRLPARSQHVGLRRSSSRLVPRTASLEAPAGAQQQLEQCGCSVVTLDAAATPAVAAPVFLYFQHKLTWIFCVMPAACSMVAQLLLHRLTGHLHSSSRRGSSRLSQDLMSLRASAGPRPGGLSSPCTTWTQRSPCPLPCWATPMWCGLSPRASSGG
jgi:hypothetical protein